MYTIGYMIIIIIIITMLYHFQYKISFALDLARSDAGINRKDQGSNDSTVIKTNGTELEKRNNANNVANKATKQGNETPGMKETGGKGDEADVGRTTVSQSRAGVKVWGGYRDR